MVKYWNSKNSQHGAISSGLRAATLSGYVGCNYAELNQLDTMERGPTLGLRCSAANPESPTAHLFTYSEMICEGKRGVIIEQSVGTVTLWRATKYAHTSSVDEHSYLKFLDGDSQENDCLSVGLVVVQKTKNLSIPLKRYDVISRLYSVSVLKAYGLLETASTSTSLKREVSDKGKSQAEWKRRRVRS